LTQEYFDEVKAHFNEPILIWSTLCRCVGYAEDEWDCYIIVDEIGGRRGYVSLVGGFIYLDRLKGQGEGGEWDDLKRLDLLLELNGAPKVNEFVLEV
jgi:hypothetical protein